jgi:hypothetical protein
MNPSFLKCLKFFLAGLISFSSFLSTVKIIAKFILQGVHFQKTERRLSLERKQPLILFLATLTKDKRGTANITIP